MLGTLVLTAPAHAQLLSPGPLARDHARWEGDDHCSECHSSGRQVDNNKCLACHRELGARVRAGAGLHGREYRGQQCAQCHVDHRGVESHLVRWPGGGPDHFDHRQAGWPLGGAHARVTCNNCHNRRTRSGARTFLGLGTTCRSCHEDPHSGRFGAECQSCHNDRDWHAVNMQRFNHTVTRFPLEGAHARVQCARCHGTPARWRGIDFGSCTNCHRDVHEGRFGANCSSCHNETSWTAVTMTRAAHPGLSLANGHARVACNRCHDRGESSPPSRGSACASCHRPVHEARFGRDCNDCHRSIRWLGIADSVGRSAHARTPFPLRGAHETTDCAGCHRTTLSVNARYRELTFDKCGRCHADRHANEFAARDGGECAACHDETAFRPALFGVAMHRTTQFELVGRHEAAPCSGCHRAPPPRLDLRIAVQTCQSCHENPHGDQFSTEMRDRGCAHCHTSLGWDRPNIDHSTWPLTGAHAQAACGSCHTPSEADRHSGRGASYRGVPRECEGCHDDAHGAQFRLTQPVRQCPACHDTDSFRVRRFDHSGVTGFALDGRHRRVACTGCHRETTLRNQAHVVLWRLGYRQCADCHANPHEGGA